MEFKPGKKYRLDWYPPGHYMFFIGWDKYDRPVFQGIYGELLWLNPDNPDYNWEQYKEKKHGLGK